MTAGYDSNGKKKKGILQLHKAAVAREHLRKSIWNVVVVVVFKKS